MITTEIIKRFGFVDETLKQLRLQVKKDPHRSPSAPLDNVRGALTAQN